VVLFFAIKKPVVEITPGELLGYGERQGEGRAAVRADDVMPVAFGVDLAAADAEFLAASRAGEDAADLQKAPAIRTVRFWHRVHRVHGPSLYFRPHTESISV
jgi:hypothetical protein